MSPDRSVPPAGEEIHLPGPSLQPVLLTLGITLALVGITIHAYILVAGMVLTVWVIARWIGDTRREMAAPPAEHAEH